MYENPWKSMDIQMESPAFQLYENIQKTPFFNLDQPLLAATLLLLKCDFRIGHCFLAKQN